MDQPYYHVHNTTDSGKTTVLITTHQGWFFSEMGKLPIMNYTLERPKKYNCSVFKEKLPVVNIQIIAMFDNHYA